MAQLISLGYELEASRSRVRGRTHLIAPERYYQGTRGWRESSKISEWRLRPVKIVNERNTIRRFLCNMLTGGVTKERECDIDFQGYKLNIEKNYEGATTRKGESGHFHMKFEPNRIQRQSKFTEVLTLLTPFFARRTSWRETIEYRAEVSLSIYTDTKSYSYCYNTGPDTYEIRLNESLVFPVVAGLISMATVENNFRGINIDTDFVDDLKREINNRRRINKESRRALLPKVIELIDYTIDYINANRERFSARGKHYKKLLEITKANMNRWYVNAPAKFEIMCAGDFVSYFYERDRRFREYVNNIYIPFYSEYISDGNQVDIDGAAYLEF